MRAVGYLYVKAEELTAALADQSPRTGERDPVFDGLKPSQH